MVNGDNPLAQMTPTELHEEGLKYLMFARQLMQAEPNAATAASVAIASFFASMSAESLGAEAGAHRTDENTPPRGVPTVRERTDA